MNTATRIGKMKGEIDYSNRTVILVDNNYKLIKFDISLEDDMSEAVGYIVDEYTEYNIKNK